jgi:hypothetical protein
MICGIIATVLLILGVILLAVGITVAVVNAPTGPPGSITTNVL